jgi:hypothetical protein
MARNKYGNRKVEMDGVVFDSVAERNRYVELKLLLVAGEISNLELQPRFELQPSFKRGKKTIRRVEYVADFAYTENGRRVVEDVKGGKATQTQVFRLKEKLFLFRYADLELRIVA